MSRCRHFKLKSEFDYMRATGVKFASRSFLFIFAPSLDGELRCGVICSKKYSPLAVKRNRARRLLYESFRLLQNDLSPAWILMIPRQALAKCKCQQVLAEMRQCAEQSHLLGGGK